MNLEQILERSLVNNREGLLAFLERLVVHDGTLQVELLYKVARNIDGELHIRKGHKGDTANDIAVGMGGEIPNSFSPLYEISYFFQCLFLSAVGTVFLNSSGGQPYQGFTTAELRQHLTAFLGEVRGTDLVGAIRAPAISVICSLDTDIELLRYGKHQLWNIAPEASRRYVSSIGQEFFHGGRIDERLMGTYWCQADLEIAQWALAHSRTLPEAKMLQFYETLRRIVTPLGLELDRIPLFFNLATIDEVRALGPDNEYLDILQALHQRSARSAMRRITRQHHPWILTFPCPKCGQSSKRVLQTRLMGDGRSVKLHCRRQETWFRTEMGNTFSTQGCGYRFEVEVPREPGALYQLLTKTGFSIQFAARQLIAILKTSIDTPVCLVVTDVGVTRNADRQLTRNRLLPPGYGDHFDMLTSMLAVETFFLEGLVSPDLSNWLTAAGVMTSKPLMILGYDHAARLVDTAVFSMDAGVPVTDTSALKAIQQGKTVLDMLQRSISYYNFELPDMLALRDSRTNSMEVIRQGLAERIGQKSEH